MKVMVNVFYLLTYDDNWSDEMDIDGVIVLNQEKYIKFLEAVENFDYTEFVIGTNQYIEYDSKEAIEDVFSVKTITKEEYDLLIQLGINKIGFAEDFVDEIIYNYNNVDRW